MGRGPRHVLIYGPPAAGKLTVATRLADLYDVRVLDNHASIDPALRLFSFGTTEFAQLVEEIRVALIGAAARAGIDIVSTLVYAHGLDDRHVARLTEATACHGGMVHLVQLRPPDRVLEARVASETRLSTSKVKDADELRKVLQQYDLTTPISGEDLVIDNAEATADEVARLIGARYQLRERAR
jgi:hypothetical protein